jgi:hypothetical protein
MARTRSAPASRRSRLDGQPLDRGEIEVAVVGAETLGDKRRRRAAEHGGVTAVAPQREAAQETGGERVAAARGVDGLDLEGGNPLGALPVDEHNALGAAGGDHAAHAALEQRPAAVLELVGAGQREHLLAVRQQVVELR